jgi:TonB family protein
MGIRQQTGMRAVAATIGGAMRVLLTTTLVCASVILSAQGSETVYAPGNGVSLPSVVTQVKADYTQEAKDQRIEGTVLLESVVKSDGSVGAVAVVQSLDSVFGLDREAVKAMRQWEFKPGTKEGKAVAVKVVIEMTFSFKD